MDDHLIIRPGQTMWLDEFSTIEDYWAMANLLNFNKPKTGDKAVKFLKNRIE